MTPHNRTIDACRGAGLPVVDEHDCTCGLDGRLVVVARAAGLDLIWPYDRRCPIHDPGELGAWNHRHELRASRDIRPGRQRQSNVRSIPSGIPRPEVRDRRAR
jgi:hypothetical protein